MAKSILQHNKECYICRQQAEVNSYFGYLTDVGLEEHHIFYGTSNRKKSEKYGLKVCLCHRHHQDHTYGVHHNREMDLNLKTEAQEAFETLHNRNQFLDIFGRSWL